MSYTTAHLRVTHERGPARERPCTGCDEPAAQWAYDHRDPAEVVDDERAAPYSDDPAHYLPLCASCHTLYDRDRLGWHPCARPGCSRLTQRRYDLCHRHPARPARAPARIPLGHSFGPADELGRKRRPRVHHVGPATEKRCPACELVKPSAAFSADRSKASGLASRCLPCDRAHSAARYRARLRARA